jgi:hypothetical protein
MLATGITALMLLTLSGVLAATVEVIDGVETFAPPAPERKLPPSADLRLRFHEWKLEPRRQGGRGTCSVFTVAGALEYAVAAGRKSGMRLSVEFLNWAGHKAAHRTADGGFFSELWQGYAEFGICAEDDLPYQTHYDPDLQPPDAALERARGLQQLGLHMEWIKEWDPHTGITDEQLTAIKRTLHNGWPVCGGFRWPKKAHWQQDVLQLCPPEEVFDGHSVLLIGYRDDAAQPGGGLFLIRNSGGNGSDGWLPYDYMRAYMNDALWIESRATDVKPAEIKSAELKQK